MKIAKYGTVTITEKDILVDGWLMTPEPTDPPEAKTEELLLATVIPWARQRFNDIANREVMKAVFTGKPH